MELVNPFVNIIILNWNGFQDTAACINSLMKISYNNYKIIVVDNASDNDAQKLQKEFGDTIHLIRNEINLGFSGGNNSGIEYALKQKPEFILLINNDTVVENNFLDELLITANSFSNAGIIGPVIGYFNNREKIWSADGKISKIRSSGFIKKINMDINSIKFDKNCTFLSGCCMLIKRDVFEKIGMLDENYFLYLEDSDFCWRTLKAGYKIFLSAKSRIYHKVNISTKRDNPLLPLYYTTRNRLYFAKKNLGNWFYAFYPYLIISMAIKNLLPNNRVEKKVFVKKALKDFKDYKMGQIVN
jgi:GT2 family glycosyltransferase